MSKIAVIGGSYLQLPLVLKAKELGHEVHCFSWEEGAVCKEEAQYFYPISIIEKEEIYNKCKEIGIDAIVTIASDTAVATVNYVASRLNLISNPDNFTDITSDKYLMAKTFEKMNVPAPKFIKISKGENLVMENLEFPLIVKPTDRSGSRGVKKVYNHEELQEAIHRAQEESFTKNAIVEEFIEGQEISVESISFEGNHYILQITDKVTTGEPYFVELEHHQPSSLPASVQEKVKDIVLNALNALHIKYGASHAELKITPKGEIKVIEIGARMGGDFIGSDLVKLSTGYDFLKGVIDVALNSFETPVLMENNYAGVYFLSQETKRLKDLIENAENNPNIIEAEITDNELHDIQCSGDRSGYLIYKADHKIDL